MFTGLLFTFSPVTRPETQSLKQTNLSLNNRTQQEIV
jgi:hypothetical protein